MTNLGLSVIYALLATALSRHSFQSILCLVTFYSAIAQNEILSTTTDGVNILENTNTNLVSYLTFLIFELYPMLIWYQYIASILHLLSLPQYLLFSILYFLFLFFRVVWRMEKKWSFRMWHKSIGTKWQ